MSAAISRILRLPALRSCASLLEVKWRSAAAKTIKLAFKVLNSDLELAAFIAHDVSNFAHGYATRV
jgi:hypothetical protein